MIYSVTGHRPPRLGLGYDQESNRKLTEFAESQLKQLPMCSLLLIGMAQGWDQACANACVNLGIPFTAVVPFGGQESKWPPEGKHRYECLMARAKNVHIVCSGDYAAWKFIERDRYLIDNSETVLALWDSGKKGGTAETVNYAIKQDKKVINCWLQWCNFQYGTRT